MSSSDLIATAAHLHVAMRRKMGRITDTEWMASDARYAQAMTELALQHAQEHQDGDLRKWAQRLWALWQAQLPAPAAPASPPAPMGAPEPAAPEPSEACTPPAGRYVIGLRC